LSDEAPLRQLFNRASSTSLFGVRFVHLARDPSEVFQSTVRTTTLASVYNRVQHAKRRSVAEYVLRRRELIYDAYFEDRALVEPSRLFELRQWVARVWRRSFEARGYPL